MSSRVRTIVTAALIVLAGLLFFTSDPNPQTSADPIEVGPLPQAPDPTRYPGGLTNRDYQRAARAFEAAMGRHFESITAAGDASEAQIERETGSMLLRLLAFVAVIAAVGVAVGGRKGRRVMSSPPSGAASTPA